MPGVGIQVSAKLPDGTLVNIQGDDPGEIDTHLTWVAENAAGVAATVQALYDAYSPRTVEQGVANVEAQMSVQGGPPSQQYQQTVCDRCKTSPICPACGAPAHVQAKSVKDGQYFLHECTVNPDHKPKWCNLPKGR